MFHDLSRPVPVGRPGLRGPYRPWLEELEVRRLLSTGPPLPLNQPLTTDANVQQMPSVAVDPHDANHLVVAYMDRSLLGSGYAGLGAKVSQDGGASWQQTTLPLPAGFDQGAAGPVVRFDDQGHVYVSFQAATFLGPTPALTSLISRQRALGFQSNNGIFVDRSDDGGLTWGQPAAVAAHLYDGVHPVDFELYPDLAIDTFPTLPGGQANPNYGNLYETWARIYAAGHFPGEADSTGGSDVMVAVSRDGGRTWAIQLQQLPGTGVLVSVIEKDDPGSPNTGEAIPPGLGFMVYPHVTVGPDGDVYVGLYEGGKFAVHHSTDAGASFAGPDFNTTQRLAFGLDQALINNGGLFNDSFRTLTVRAIAADPVRPGTVYAVEVVRVDDPSGNTIDAADVFFARSTDYGLTWQRTIKVGTYSGIILNDDNDALSASGQSKEDVISGQALPRLAVDAQGNIAVIWYDTRRDPADHLLDVFGSVSTDGGLTFSPNFRVTNTSFDPDAGAFFDPTGKKNFYLGDAIGLAVANNTAYATWTDTRNGNQDVYFARFSIAPALLPPNDRFEPNDTAATATDLGQKVQRYVPKLALPPGDMDWFRVQATATGNLIVTATEVVPGSGLRLELWDAGGTSLLATGTGVVDATGRVIGAQIASPASSGHFYLIRVVAVDGGASRYALQIQSLTADLGTLVHHVQPGTLAPGDQVYYLLAAGAPGSLEAKLTAGANVQGSFNLELLDPNTLAPVASGVPSGSPGPGQVDRASLAVAQGQAVLIHVSGSATTQGTFTLEITNLDQYTTPDNTSLAFPAGNGPSKVVMGDLNGDGKPDLVVSNFLANTVSVLLGNGDGTFQTPRQYAIGALKTTFTPGIDTQVLDFRRRRDLRLADFNGDGILDSVVTDYDSGDVTVLLGRGDGTFQAPRRVNATPAPLGLAIGDVNNDGQLDLVAIDSTTADVPNNIAVLLGRGDGTFEPEQIFQPPNVLFLANIRLVDLNRDGNLDLVVGGGQDGGIEVYLGNGGGTFTYTGHFDGSRQAADMVVADLDHDGNPDLILADFSEINGVTVLLGNGDGTFQAPQDFFSGQGPDAVQLLPSGSETILPGGSTAPGPANGTSLVVANSGQLTGLPTLVGPPNIVVLPGMYDPRGNFLGFDSPQPVATAIDPTGLAVGDVNGDGVTDIAVADEDGVKIIFGKPPVIVPNDTLPTARNLGTVVHVLEPTLTIVPGHEDSYFRLQVPAEAARGAGDEVLDFSALVQEAEAPGLQMEVRDAAGNLLGSGSRFQVAAPQGAGLLVHVFGVPGAGGTRGTGAYTLDIDVLPQVVAVQAQALLPGARTDPGGPTASLVVTLQGDRLDPATAEDPANYRVTWLGPDGLAGTADDRAIVVAATGQPVVYDPSTNVDVASGVTFPAAVRQTVTLLFDSPLPAGSYLVELTAGIRTAAINAGEAGLLAGSPGHPLVSLGHGQVRAGSRQQVPGLVAAPGALGDFGVWRPGTPFLTQLHDDLGALLDAGLTRLSDDPRIPLAVTAQILERFLPALGSSSRRPTGVLVIWLDPVSFNLADSEGRRVVYKLKDGSFRNDFSTAFVNVTGNIEVLVVPTIGGQFTLNLGDVPENARGGAVLLGLDNQTVQLTAGIRTGTRRFEFTVAFSLGTAGAGGAAGATGSSLRLFRDLRDEIGLLLNSSPSAFGGISARGSTAASVLAALSNFLSFEEEVGLYAGAVPSRSGDADPVSRERASFEGVVTWVRLVLMEVAGYSRILGEMGSRTLREFLGVLPTALPPLPWGDPGVLGAPGPNVGRDLGTALARAGWNTLEVADGLMRSLLRSDDRLAAPTGTGPAEPLPPAADAGEDEPPAVRASFLEGPGRERSRDSAGAFLPYLLALCGFCEETRRPAPCATRRRPGLVRRQVL